MARDAPDSHSVDRVLGKPVRLDDLLEAIAEVRLAESSSVAFAPQHSLT